MRMRHTIGLSLAIAGDIDGAMAKAGPRRGPTHPRQETPRGARASAKPAKPAENSASAAIETDRRARHGSESARPDRHHHRDDDVQETAPTVSSARCEVIGAREVGSASWYGGRHLGRRTASGERLDAIHATAAHRSLPLQSLVRVTNLRNGRSIIVKITDRGPVSRSLLIDLSPSAAEELDMKQAGIVPVAVEPVGSSASAAN